ncbi:MAG: DNA polymerase III subunit delta' [Alphaproteobacteria bacterium]|nr:DNA polymerase III subunit delta' [Alphaproteobacteria bacterium]
MAQSLILKPREQSFFYGHEVQSNWFLSSYKLGRLPHGLLLVGPSGVGKATFAFQVARHLLAFPQGCSDCHAFGLPIEHPVFRRVASGGHGDLLVIEPEISLEGQNAKEINVESLRSVSHFLSQTSLEGGWRVVIIDGDMNRNAANAILKILEEPPVRTLVMILTESLGRVIPTIRSRCQKLNFGALKDQEVAHIVSLIFPKISSTDLKIITELAEGRPGRALQLYEAGGAGVYCDLIEVFNAIDPFSLSKIHEFCQKYAAKPKKEDGMNLFVLVGELIEYWLYKAVAYLLSPEKNAISEVVQNEIQSFTQAARIREVAEWSVVWEKVTESFRHARQSHLDRYQVLIEVFTTLSSSNSSLCYEL